MKVHLNIEKHNLEYLNKILRNYNNIVDPIPYSFQTHVALVMVSISYDDYLFLADHNAFKEI